MMKKLILILILFVSVLFPQNDLNNRFMLANSYEQAGEFERAKLILEDLYAKQPENYQFFEALNRVYLQLKNYEGSEKIIKDRIAKNPQDVNMYGLLGKTFHLRGEEKKAFEIWDEAIELSSHNLGVYKLIANYAIERREFTKAIEVLNRGKERAPEPGIFSYDLASLYSLTMNYTKTAEEYVSLLRSIPAEIHNIRSRMTGYLNKPEALKETITVFEKEENKTQEINLILAWLYTDNKNFDAAFRLYIEFDRSKGSNGGEIFNFAQQLYNLREFETAARVFAEIFDEYASSPLASASKLWYAKSVEEQLRITEAANSDNWKPVKKTTAYSTEEADKLINIYIDLSTRERAVGDMKDEAIYRTGRIYLYIKNEPAKAEEFFRKLVDNYPLSSFASLSAIELSSIFIKRVELEDALSCLQKVSQFPRATDEQKNRGKLLTAEIYFYRKEFDPAKRLLAQILTNLKDNSANDAIELSLLLNTKMNDSLSLLTFADAELLTAQERFDEAKLKYSSISAEKGGFILGSLAKLKEAEIELALNNTERSIELLESISGEESRNIYSDKALYLLGNIFEYSLNDSQKAVEIYEKLLAKFPGSLYLDEARDRILNLRKKLS